VEKTGSSQFRVRVRVRVSEIYPEDIKHFRANVAFDMGLAGRFIAG